MAKHLEHYLASGCNGQVGEGLSAANQRAATTVSASRIDELKVSPSRPVADAVRP